MFISDFELRFKFHSENEFPFPEPLSQATKTYPSRRARNNAGWSNSLTATINDYQDPVDQFSKTLHAKKKRKKKNF